MQWNEGGGDSRRAFVGVEHTELACVSKSPGANKFPTLSNRLTSYLLLEIYPFFVDKSGVLRAIGIFVDLIKI